MSKKIKYSLSIVSIFLILLAVFLIKSSTKKTNVLKEPQKIIFNELNKGTKELSKGDPLFDDLFHAMSIRIVDQELIRFPIPIEDTYTDNYTEGLKDQCSFIELIYDKEQKLHVPLVYEGSSTIKDPVDITYTKLCFTLGDYIMPMSGTFHFGDNKAYSQCFISGIKTLEETSDLLKKEDPS